MLVTHCIGSLYNFSLVSLAWAWLCLGVVGQMHHPSRNYTDLGVCSSSCWDHFLELELELELEQGLVQGLKQGLQQGLQQRLQQALQQGLLQPAGAHVLGCYLSLLG